MCEHRPAQAIIKKDLSLIGISVAAIGEITANAVEQQGLSVDYCPDTYLAENFIDQFPDYPNLAGQRILWPRTNIGRDLIAEKLQAAGAIVHAVPAYKTILPLNAKDLSAQLNKLIVDKQLDAITLASRQTAINLSKIISLNLGKNTNSLPTSQPGCEAQSAAVPDDEGCLQLACLLNDVVIVTIGPQTAEGALNYLGKESLQAKPYTSDGMVATLIEHYRKNMDAHATP
jgi:uroporphyrinogen-III synthase